jgi:hypothetical protein
MSGDVHVRLCERLGVRFPRAPLGEFVRQNALEIFELWEVARRELGDPRAIFWTKLAELVRQGIASRQRGKWKVALSPEDANELSRRNAGELDITESDLVSGRLYCYFAIQEFKGVLYYGISWSEQLSPERERRILRASSELVSLRNDLQNQDFKRVVHGSATHPRGDENGVC